MHVVSKGVAAALFAALITGCTSTPPAEDMTALGKEEVMNVFAGNTLKARLFSTAGSLTNAFNADLSGGGAKAQGNGWLHKVTHTSTVSDDGEICSVFAGDYEWSKPEFEYCSRYLTDGNGKYFQEVTRDPRDGSHVGKVRPIKLVDGDPSGLLNQ